MHKQTCTGAHNAHICTAICPERSAYSEPPESAHLGLSSRSTNAHLLPSVSPHPSSQALMSKPHPPSLSAHLPNYPTSHSAKTHKQFKTCRVNQNNTSAARPQLDCMDDQCVCVYCMRASVYVCVLHDIIQLFLWAELHPAK